MNLCIPKISVFFSQLNTQKGSKHHWRVRDCGSNVKFIRLGSLCFLAFAIRPIEPCIGYSPANSRQLLSPQSFDCAGEWIRVEGTGNVSSQEHFIRLLHSRGDRLPFRSTETEKLLKIKRKPV